MLFVIFLAVIELAVIYALEERCGQSSRHR